MLKRLLQNARSHLLAALARLKIERQAKRREVKLGWKLNRPKVIKPRTYKPIHLATLIALAVLALAVTSLAARFMWDAAQVPANLPNSPDLAVRTAQLRVDVIRNILAVGAGTGGLIALFLALRRQYVKERVDYADQEHKNQTAKDARFDAGERRVTDLYVKAAEQLGSDKPAVRLAALYALERVGQDNPEHRQTIINLICAYLRMPFHGKGVDSEEDQAERDEEREKRHQEREVRVAAQRILSKHLQYFRLTGEGRERRASGGPSFWEGAEVDLTGAFLINLNLSNCAVDVISLREARLVGSADFTRFYSGSSASFARAKFFGAANFYSAEFRTFAIFSGAQFQYSATFNSARMDEGCSFQRATFHGITRFHKTRSLSFMFDRARAYLKLSTQHVWPKGFVLVEDDPESAYGEIVEITDRDDPDDDLERDWDEAEQPQASPEVPQQPKLRDPVNPQPSPNPDE